MSRGVVYFNKGGKCVVRMIVSIYSLRKYYSGSITCIICGEQPEGFIKVLQDLNVDILDIPDEGLYPLVVKSKLWRYSPYDTTLFIDADTVIVNNIDLVFPIIEKYGFCVYRFADWVNTGSHMSNRINAMTSICPEYVKPTFDYKYAINTGVVGWSKNGLHFLSEWEELTQKTYDNNVLRIIVDEIVCQMLLHKHKHFLLGSEYGISIKYGKIPDNPIIYHFHGRKHVSIYERSKIWRQEYWELVKQKGYTILSNPNGDKRFSKYLTNITNNSYTIVTAVDSKYLQKLRTNYQKWIQTEGIMEYPIIVFFDSKTVSLNELDFLGSNVEKISWDYANVKTQREKMLACFIFGSAKYVKTKYWLKLDADCIPIKKDSFGYKFDVDKDWISGKYEVVSGRWGYTKSYGQGWLNILEEWGDKIFPNTNRIFPESDWEIMKTCIRYYHKRIISYCHFEKTEFTRKISEYCNGILPIPSHDTIVSYILERMHLSYLKLRMKNWFVH